MCRRSDARGTSPLGHLPWLLGQLQDNSPLLVESEQRKRGKHNRADEQQRRNPRKERPQTQPQIYPDTAVNPGNEQHRDLHHAVIGPYQPQIIQGLPITFLQPPQLGSEPLAYDMRAKQRRNTKTKDELDEFCRFPFEMPALVERPQSERPVDRESGIKQQRSRQAAPQRHMEPKPVLHGGERNIAQRMIDEMTEQIGEKDKAGGETNLPHADAAQKCARIKAGSDLIQSLLREDDCACRALVAVDPCAQRGGETEDGSRDSPGSITAFLTRTNILLSVNGCKPGTEHTIAR